MDWSSATFQLAWVYPRKIASPPADWADDIGIGDNLMSNLAVMATEGFGPIPINSDSFAFLRELEGQRVAMLTTTRVNGFLSRPQVIAVDMDALDDDAVASHVTVTEQTRVRLVDPSGLGLVGTVAEKSRRTRRSDSMILRSIS